MPPRIGIRLALSALARRPPPLARALWSPRSPTLPSTPWYLAKAAIGKEADESVPHARAA